MKHTASVSMNAHFLGKKRPGDSGRSLSTPTLTSSNPQLLGNTSLWTWTFRSWHQRADGRRRRLLVVTVGQWHVGESRRVSCSSKRLVGGFRSTYQIIWDSLNQSVRVRIAPFAIFNFGARPGLLLAFKIFTSGLMEEQIPTKCRHLQVVASDFLGIKLDAHTIPRC